MRSNEDGSSEIVVTTALSHYRPAGGMMRGIIIYVYTSLIVTYLTRESVSPLNSPFIGLLSSKADINVGLNCCACIPGYSMTLNNFNCSVCSDLRFRIEENRL